jgi:hypothetical protein
MPLVMINQQDALKTIPPREIVKLDRLLLRTLRSVLALANELLDLTFWVDVHYLCVQSHVDDHRG